MISLLLFSPLFGFIGAAIIQKLLRGPLRFRAEWNTTFIACTLTAFICGVVLFMSFIIYEKESSDHLLKAVGTTAFISLLAGTLSCRFIIRSQSGRNLHPLIAGCLALALTVPPLLVGVILSLAIEK